MYLFEETAFFNINEALIFLDDMFEQIGPLFSIFAFFNVFTW